MTSARSAIKNPGSSGFLMLVPLFFLLVSEGALPFQEKDLRNKLNEERLQKNEESKTRLNEKIAVTAGGLLGEIPRFVESHAEKDGYDIVFDTSGTSTNQTPFVLGGKEIIDITASVVSEPNGEDPCLKEKR
jgi:hypothetical protein